MWISRSAVSWSTESVVIERTSVRSSTIPASVRQQLAEHHPRLAVRPEPERRGQQVARLLVEVDLELAGIRLAVMLRQLGLGVEQVHLARPAVLEQADDRLGSGAWRCRPSTAGRAGCASPARTCSCSSR